MNPNDVAIYGATAALLGVPVLAWLVVRGPAWARTWPIGPAPLELRDDGPHEHRYEAVTAPYFPRDPYDMAPPFGGVFQIITGYRCRCGKPRPLALKFDPVANARAALERYRVAPEHAWEAYRSPPRYSRPEGNPDP